MGLRLLTSESVTEGHPDKIADQVSDVILDAVLQDDAEARVACEVLVTTGMVLVAGEVTTTASLLVPELVRGTLRSIGYTDAGHGLDAESCAVLVTLDRQSPDIAMGVDIGGAGDQGMMYGYATDELKGIGDSDALMPAPVWFAHRLTQRLAQLRKDGTLGWLRPDGKAQVTVAYEDDLPVRVDSVVLSAQHSPDLTLEEVRAALIDEVIVPTLPAEIFDPAKAALHINPTGRFVVGGPHGDTGLTGRKIVVDTYGGAALHGGGAFSGKDASKVDRSAAYAARWAAKHVVALGAASRCQVALAYAIGVAEPVAVQVETFGTAQGVSDDAIARALREVFDFRPRAIIEALALDSPIYRPTAAYGHFGREPFTERRAGRELAFFPWERIDRLDELGDALGG